MYILSSRVFCTKVSHLFQNPAVCIRLLCLKIDFANQLNVFRYRFSALLPYQSPSEMDALSEEFIVYQLYKDEAIPKEVWSEAALTEESSAQVVHHRCDVIWRYLSNVCDSNGVLSFGRLSKIAKLILILPHSNAEEERVFSMIRKNKTVFRASLDPEGTLSSIVTIKLAHSEATSDFNPPKTLLKQAKSATWQYNKEHSRK